MLAVIVNPRAGGGRAGRGAPGGAGRRSRGCGLEHHVELTRSLDHAVELARAAQRGRRDGGRARRRRSDRRGRRRAVATATASLGVLPAGTRQRLRPGARHPAASRRGLRGARARAARGRLTSAMSTGRAFIGIASCGFDSVANRIANETRLVRGNLVYTYAGLRALMAWRPAHFDLQIDGETAEPRGDDDRGRELGRLRRRHDARAGGPARRRPARRRPDRRSSRAAVPARPAQVFDGSHVQLPTVEIVRAREVAIASRTPFTMYADGDPVAELPVTRPVPPGRDPGDRARADDGAPACTKIVAARAVGELARRAGRGGGTSLPGRVLLALEPNAITELAARLPRGSAVISATNGKTTTAALAASILRPRGDRARPQPRRREHGRRRRLDAAAERALRTAPDRRRARAVRARRVLARPRRDADQPRVRAARQPVPRPARSLRRAGDDRRPLGGDRRRAAHRQPARARRRRPADRGPRTRARRT